MFGRGFVSFISWSTVSAYLARAWHPLRRDEVFSFGKCFLPNQIFVQQLFFQPRRSNPTEQKRQWVFSLCFIVPSGNNDRNILFVLSDHTVFKPWASTNVHLYRLNTVQVDFQQICKLNQRHFILANQEIKCFKNYVKEKLLKSIELVSSRINPALLSNYYRYHQWYSWFPSLVTVLSLNTWWHYT